MRAIVYDATEKRRSLALPWRVGASLFGDAVIAATSWADVFLGISALPRVDEVQFWGHGLPGDVFVGRERLRLNDLGAVRHVLAPRALWWWRTCSSFAGAAGHAFARGCVLSLGCRVAGSTFKIGAIHGGQRSLRPGDAPHWTTWEGFNPDRTPAWSTLSSPNRLFFFARDLPASW